MMYLNMRECPPATPLTLGIFFSFYCLNPSGLILVSLTCIFLVLQEERVKIKTIKKQILGVLGLNSIGIRGKFQCQFISNSIGQQYNLEKAQIYLTVL